ncbi:Hypothetical protein SMAX5B_022168 [Scophthalmus maximus]|uniref:Uncharacterized protein n=1 Tax=Scophthalmus maximus TaxID=52904 RepID=A0A2U9B791_SCOMX|nr:Hypothetical protein SMAX5B_022168 [Scophthalmus maximus]
MPDCFRGRGFGSGMGSCGLAVLKGAQLTLQGQILVIVTTEEEEDCGGVITNCENRTQENMGIIYSTRLTSLQRGVRCIARLQ